MKDPAYERITFGNLIGALGNCSAAMVQHHLTIAGVPEGEAGETIPYDLASDMEIKAGRLPILSPSSNFSDLHQQSYRTHHFGYQYFCSR